MQCTDDWALLAHCQEDLQLINLLPTKLDLKVSTGEIKTRNRARDENETDVQIDV